MLKSPISNDTFLVSDPERPGNKISVSKLLLHISIYEIHNNLISESIIYQLKEAIDETTGNPLIGDTALHEIITNNVQEMKYRYK